MTALFLSPACGGIRRGLLPRGGKPLSAFIIWGERPRVLDVTRGERTGITSTLPYPVILSDSEESKLAPDHMLRGHRGCATWSSRRFVVKADTYLVRQDFIEINWG